MKINLHNFGVTKNILNSSIEIIDSLDSFKRNNKVGFFPLLRKNIFASSVTSSVLIDGIKLNKNQIDLIINQKRVFAPQNQIAITKNTIDLWSFINDCNGLSENDFFLAYGELSKNIIDETKMLRSKEKADCISTSLIPNKLSDLFKWLQKDNLHMLIKSCIFHFEILCLQPFAIENEKIARAWQIALLNEINPIFGYIELEKQIYLHKNQYFETFNRSKQSYDSTYFIELMLNLILLSLKKLQNKLQEQVRSTKNEITRLLLVVSDTPKSSLQIMKELKLKNQPNFYRRYLKPALKQKLIQRTDPNPKSRNQKYIRRDI